MLWLEVLGCNSLCAIEGRQFDSTEVGYKVSTLYMGRSCDGPIGSVMVLLFCYKPWPMHRTGWPSIDWFSPATMPTRGSVLSAGIHKANALRTSAQKYLN
jgi:hypothetical protein